MVNPPSSVLNLCRHNYNLAIDVGITADHGSLGSLLVQLDEEQHDDRGEEAVVESYNGKEQGYEHDRLKGGRVLID